MLAELKPAFGASTRASGSDKRTVVDVLAGVTQVISRQWLVQANYNLGRGSGYHSDPYKVLSVIDGTTGLLTAGQQCELVESRPRSRTRHSFNLQSKWHLTEDVVDVGYRYYTDSWGLRAHTLDARYRYELGGWHVPGTAPRGCTARTRRTSIAPGSPRAPTTTAPRSKARWPAPRQTRAWRRSPHAPSA